MPLVLTQVFRGLRHTGKSSIGILIRNYRSSKRIPSAIDFSMAEIGSQSDTAITLLPVTTRSKALFEVRDSQLFVNIVKNSVPVLVGNIRDFNLGGGDIGELSRSFVTSEKEHLFALQYYGGQLPDIRVLSAAGAANLSQQSESWGIVRGKKVNIVRLSPSNCVLGISPVAKSTVTLYLSTGVKKRMMTRQGIFCFLLEKGAIPQQISVRTKDGIIAEQSIDSAGVVSWP